jgi:hypothetical protein
MTDKEKVKHTKESLSKIDWKKFAKGEWSAELAFNLVIRRNYGPAMATLAEFGWQVSLPDNPMERAEQVLKQIERCNAFIASELARIEQEEKATRLPKTKAPEGWSWSRPSGGETVWLDDGTRSWSLPDEHARVVFGLLCKAYDELHGVETVNSEAQIVEFDSINHPTQKGGH